MRTAEPEQKIRCAIYTRKSTEEGLEQEFNSLNAQREAAEAYIASQRSEGWTCLPAQYDDGGFTGGNVERPALQRLLHDVEAGRIDCVIVYKVDRLSRSLLDFSRLMDVFDKKRVSFVSVTQQFNTTHSMGRLTLNILLSFAQFEREIIAERTKDKMSAARRKGKWVGGIPPLGYDIAPNGRKLLVNPEEASQVRALFDLYLERESLLEVVEECLERGWATKSWSSSKGRDFGGKAYTKNSLLRLLRSKTYLGKVDYEGQVYKGEHEALVAEDVWQEVQSILTRNARNGGKEVRNRYGALLRNLLHCTACNCGMVHTVAMKNNRHYRYYVCRNAQQIGWKHCPTKSLNAHEIEKAVVAHIKSVSAHPEMIEAVLLKAREGEEKAVADLRAERSFLAKEIDTCNAQIAKAATFGNTDQLADLHDLLRRQEQRHSTVISDLQAWEQERLVPETVTAALRDFSPIWDELMPGEKVKILQAILERVSYDGRNGSVTVQFRSAGLAALCRNIQRK